MNASLSSKGLTNVTSKDLDGHFAFVVGADRYDYPRLVANPVSKSNEITSSHANGVSGRNKSIPMFHVVLVSRKFTDEKVTIFCDKEPAGEEEEA
jgi:hypothetical protein